ncbi:DUF397 domain-containing protein [Saccharopolyspora sp. MS10]|uniref:DUF397 domain-containing protein n=1 Tax=Saccharopolyspora sp. MS10 TaxID=3385973 RepID=UPI00399F942C
MTTPDADRVSWRRSSRSSGGLNNCVELGARDRSWLGIRDSKDPHGPSLALSHRTITAFVAAIKRDELR